MSRWLRVLLLYIEGLSTIIVGLVAVFAPELVFDKITNVPPDDAGLAVARQLGTAWIVAGSVACLMASIRDPRSLRMIAVPLLVGDIFHVIAVWPWDAFALTHIIPTTIYFLNRGSIALWPESFIKKP